MLKYLAIIVSCVCVTIVVAETAGLAVLWQQGMLGETQVREIRQVLVGDPLGDALPPEESPKSPAAPTLQDVAQTRALSILKLDQRESELTVMKESLDEERQTLEQRQKRFREERVAFQEELKALAEELNSTATEQGRAVLAALPPKEAVKQLMQVSLQDGVRLLKGMPDKTIAKILKEFAATPVTAPGTTAPSGDTPAERGKRIFQELSRGEPQRQLVNQTADRLAEDDGRTGP